MGQKYSQAVPSPEHVPDNSGYFTILRYFGIWPTLYGPNKTAVTVDVLEAGLILAVVMLAFCFYIVLPGIRGRERLFCFIRVTVSLFLGACIILCNWGQEWEVDKITSKTQYRAFTNQPITAEIGIKIGLRNVNITLKANNESQQRLNETINYNERFWWSGNNWHQGRIGFGPYSGSINQEFRAAQRKGLPYPILWIAEYFIFDGEGIRWGRHYRTAGWYTHIMLWTAFPCWILANILFYINIRYGGYMTMLMGFLMLIGNACWGGIRNFIDLQIPFEEGKSLYPVFGWCFWLNLIAGFISIIIGAVVVVLDFFLPDSLYTFFGVDGFKDYEEFYPEFEDDTVETIPAASKNGASGGDAERAGASAGKRVSQPVPKFRKRGPTLKQARKPVAPPRTAPRRVAEDDEDDDTELYENAEQARQIRMEQIELKEKA